MDCFYAAVEMRDNPALRDIPIAIGGSSDRRGVISTCNYPARKFGVRSAMATAHAMKLCPHLTLVKGRMDVYVEESRKIKAVFRQYTNIIEPLSLDEAFLDVSDSNLFGGSATRIAEDIRHAIFQETGLTASAGVAPIKFVAKVASDENKPDGLCVIPPQKLLEFVTQLPLKKIPGVGKVTCEKLSLLGLETCGDVQQFPRERLLKQFGKFGKVLWDRCHAVDDRELSTSRERKSVGIETTLAQDVFTQQQCLEVIKQLYPKLIKRLKKVSPNLTVHNQGIKLKFSDFQQTTMEQRTQMVSLATFEHLLPQILQRQNQRGIRLVGLHVAMPHEADSKQLPLDFEAISENDDAES